MRRLRTIIAAVLALAILATPPAPVLGQRPCAPLSAPATPAATPVDFAPATPIATPVNFSRATPDALPLASPVGPFCKIDIIDFDFVPLQVAIRAGTTVRWINADNRIHGVRIFGVDNGNIPIPEFGSASYTFSTPGTYTYMNSEYPALPWGTIEVS